MNPTDADWWWRYAFDGIIGGLLGGMVTAFAVVLTIRHERRQARVQEMRTALARLHDTALRFAMTPPPAGPAGALPEFFEALMGLSRETSNVTTLADGEARTLRLGDELTDWDNAFLGAMMEPDVDHGRDAVRRAYALARRTGDWLISLDEGGPKGPPLDGWPAHLPPGFGAKAPRRPAATDSGSDCGSTE